VALVFRCHVVSGQPTPTVEASEVSWLMPAQVEELMNEAFATRLLDALQPGPPSVRIHDGVALLPS
jgi:hypothetical protein